MKAQESTAHLSDPGWHEEEKKAPGGVNRGKRKLSKAPLRKTLSACREAKNGSTLNSDLHCRAGKTNRKKIFGVRVSGLRVLK